MIKAAIIALILGVSATANAAVAYCTPAGGSIGCTDILTGVVQPGVSVTTVVTFDSFPVTVDRILLTGSSATWSSSSVLASRRLTITATNTGGTPARLTGEISFTPTARYVVDFETNDLSQVSQIQSCQASGTCATQSIVLVTSPAPRSGTYSAQFNDATADPPLLGHNHRSEIVVASPNGQGVTGEWWYGVSTQIPSNWSDDDSSCSNCSDPTLAPHYHLLTQFHTTSTSMQPIQLNVHDAIIRWEKYCGVSQIPTVLWSDSSAAYKGTWTDWVLHAKWTTAVDGYYEIWKNGVQIVSYAGPTLCVSSDVVYWKLGNTYDLAETRTTYIDAARMTDYSGAYSTVVPR